MQTKKYEVEVGGKKLIAEFSDLADQANGSVLVRYGGTAVFATVVMSKHTKEGVGYFPLTVDYEEKFYATGKILGGRFMKREGRPSEEAILTSRVIDRTIRPLFDQKGRNEIQVVVLALSFDDENDTDIPAVIAASLALGTSDVPWDGPVGAVRMGFDGEKFFVNPTYVERESCLLDSVICGKDGKINMIETFAKQVPESKVVEAFEEAVKQITLMEDFQKNIIEEIGKEEAVLEIEREPEEMQAFFKESVFGKLEKVMYPEVKSEGKAELGDLKKEWMNLCEEKFGDGFRLSADERFEEEINDLIHKKIVDAPEGREVRSDGRRTDELRSVHSSVNYLPELHGSGIFYRGGTHVLSVITLGGPKDGQLLDGMEVRETKHFMHHYNFPPFSVGETGRMGGVGRRAVGHGALAEKALVAVIPDREEFPYTIRLVSESMASNGSTSQGSICASTLALMDAGVPIKNPVAGIAMGIMVKDDKNYRVLTDIQGPEDHHGDMDFKCAGTKEGLTAIQMDVKVDGVTIEMLEKALAQGKKAREEILEVMLTAISEPRKELSSSAPRILKITINPEKIGEVVGPGGKMIKRITENTGAEINIEQDGTVFIVGDTKESTEKAKTFIERLTHEFKPGETVTGPVTRIFDFGAMVEIAPKREGLVHISELANHRVGKVTDVVNSGDIVTVKVVGVDEKGRLNLSLKQSVQNNNNEGEKNNTRGDQSGVRG